LTNLIPQTDLSMKQCWGNN